MQPLYNDITCIIDGYDDDFYDYIHINLSRTLRDAMLLRIFGDKAKNITRPYIKHTDWVTFATKNEYRLSHLFMKMLGLEKLCEDIDSWEHYSWHTPEPHVIMLRREKEGVHFDKENDDINTMLRDVHML